MLYYFEAILRLDMPDLQYLVESGQNIPSDAIKDVIISFGPLNEKILWGEGTGDADADEKLLREVDSRKAQMVQYLIGKGFGFNSEQLLHCYTMRCVEVAKVLLKAGVNPNGNNLCSDSTLWMLRDGMRTYRHSPGCWKILTELERLLLDWGAVEYTYGHTCIYYEAWQIQCCGDPFKVGDEIQWTGHYIGVWDSKVEQYVSFVEEHHGMDDDYLIRGKITRIYAEVDKKDNHGIYAAKADRQLLEQTEADGYLEDQSLYLWGYYVHLTDVVVDFNPNSKWPSNKKLLETRVQDKR